MAGMPSRFAGLGTKKKPRPRGTGLEMRLGNSKGRGDGPSPTRAYQTSILWSLVSLMKRQPITKVIAATTIGYQRPK